MSKTKVPTIDQKCNFRGTAVDYTGMYLYKKIWGNFKKIGEILTGKFNILEISNSTTNPTLKSYFHQIEDFESEIVEA